MLTVVTETVPFKIDAHGIARIGGTRVTLDTVIATFLEGATAEEIVQKYPTLDLADVYSVIGYYLRNRAEVENYLKKGQEQAQKIRQENEARFNPKGIRERLLARKKNQP